MSNSVKKYAAAVESGNISDISATLSAEIKIMPPGANQPNEGSAKGSMMLSAVAATVSDFKVIRTYDGSEGWSVVLLEGSIDGTPVQFIDQVHVDENELVDHIDIFLRPASMAPVLLAKVTEEIRKRTNS
jgi:hypothetical protein